MIEPMRAANEIAGVDKFAWRLVSENGERVTSSAGVTFEVDCALDQAQSLDALFVLSSPNSPFLEPKKGPAQLRALARHGCTLGGISGGVFPLARAGVLEGYRCSVHWCYETAFQAEFPHIDAADQVIIADRNRYTASGAAAAFDLALYLVENSFGAQIAHEVACWFQHSSMRGIGVRQRIPMLDGDSTEFPPLVRKATTLFASHLEETLSISEVAAQLNVTPRQVERAFKKATGQNPTHYYRAMRMKAARQLVLYSKDSFNDIARAVGYSSVTPLTHHYRAAFGLTPRADRAQTNDFRVSGNLPLPSS